MRVRGRGARARAGVEREAWAAGRTALEAEQHALDEGDDAVMLRTEAQLHENGLFSGRCEQDSPRHEFLCRLLAQPLGVRLHYGHPDIFDALVLRSDTNMSKASPNINLNEDIFAGYEAKLNELGSDSGCGLSPNP